MERGVIFIADSKGEGYGLAERIYDYVVGKEDRKFPVKMVDIEKRVFNDGEISIRVLENIRERKCFYIHDSNTMPCEWFTHLNFVLDAMKFSSDKQNINLVLPYTRFARQDRKDKSRVSVNAKVLANMISQYASRGLTLDLHAPQVQSFFDIPFDNLYSFPTIIDYFDKRHPEIFENLTIVSPDLGGGKRANSLTKRLVQRGINVEVALGYKTRKEANKVDSMIIIGNVKDKNCLIVDDLIDTGGTMKTCARLLKEGGARKVYAYGTHGLFTKWDEGFSVFDKLFVSDTLKFPIIPMPENVEVISMAGLFGEAIYRTVNGDSLSSLFDR